MDTEKVQHLWGWIGGAEAVRGVGADLSRTFCQQFLASLKTGSQLSGEPPAAFPEPPRDVTPC